MGKRKRDYVRFIKYFVFALWLASFLITIKVYKQPEVTYRAINPKTKKVFTRTVKEGYSFQQILAIYLVMGGFLFIGSLFFGAPKETSSSSVRGRKSFNLRLRLKPGFFVQPMRCPTCLSNDVHRSRKVDIEWALGWFFIAPFRCHKCFSRFYRFVFLAKK
ncbi:MAG TPA: hypothetical protein VGL91_16215 [Acidobacteriota bacterium]